MDTNNVGEIIEMIERLNEKILFSCNISERRISTIVQIGKEIPISKLVTNSTSTRPTRPYLLSTTLSLK